jgi:hypothetical protein
MFGLCVEAMGENVSVQAPAIFSEKLATLLTPLSAVVPAAATPEAQDRDGIVLLNEEINYLEEGGARYLVIHRIDKALNETGAKTIEEDTFSYRKANQKIFLVSAATILPDGRRLPVVLGAAILQTPQRQADYALYEDQGELRLIYPDIKPGAITESIVVIEESQFRIPGEFTAIFPFALGWQVRQMNRLLDMPASLADRLRVTKFGAGVPEAKKLPQPGNRVRFTWKAENIAALPAERNRPPVRDTGPILWLTSLGDWKAFTAWYAPLVEARATLSPALRQQIDAWTKDAPDAQRILEILTGKVASDVRYVGLEFGATDLQPHDCNEVWENQYGDCKDKANLLRAMLRYKGVAADLALLNTQHTGRVEQRSPDFRQFDHAIVAVERAPGEYTFCDPTITYAPPGLLSPSDADRDVLLIRADEARWVHTPPGQAGTLNYNLDLKAGGDGGLEGWLTQETTGYYGAIDADTFSRMSRERLLEKGQEIARGFFPEADVVDVTRTPIEKWDGTYRFNAYLVVRGTKQAGQDSLNLVFPQSGSLFVDLGAQKVRKTPYFLWRDTVSVSARFKLPDGCAPANLPRPFHLESPALDGTAQWTAKAGECQATLEIRLKQAVVPVAEFETFYNSLLSLRSWLANPLSVANSGGPRVGLPEKLVLEDFPILSTGDAQLELVDKRYPPGSNGRWRREALQIVKQYFPTDKPTLFHAGMQLALMDWHEENAQAALDQIVAMLQNYRGSVSAEDAAWAEYVQAMTLDDLHRSPEALPIFVRLGKDTQISVRRRAWSDYQRACILEPQAASDAIEVLREGMAFQTDAQPAEFTLLAKLLIVTGRMDDLKKEIAQLLEQKPERYVEMLTRLAGAAGTLLPPNHAAARQDLIRILGEAGKSAGLGSSFDKAWQSSRQLADTVLAADQVRERLKKHLAESPLPPLEAGPAEFQTRADFKRAAAEAEKQQKPEIALRYELEILVRFEPDEEFPSYLWKALVYAEWKQRLRKQEEPLLALLFDLCEQMPPDSDTYADGKLLRAKVIGHGGDLSRARKIHEEILRNPSVSAGFKVTTQERLARNLEDLHDYDGALAVYRTMESELDFKSVKDALLRAVFLDLELGRREEARRVLTVLGGLGKESLKRASAGVQIGELVDLSMDSGAADRYWNATAKWWPDWLAFEQRVGMESLEGVQIIPVVTDLQELGREFGTALQAKDRTTLFRDLRLLAHAARWQPTMSIELASLLVYLPGAIPEHANEFRRFGVKLAAGFVSDQPDLLRRNQFWGAVFAPEHLSSCALLPPCRRGTMKSLTPWPGYGASWRNRIMPKRERPSLPWRK